MIGNITLVIPSTIQETLKGLRFYQDMFDGTDGKNVIAIQSNKVSSTVYPAIFMLSAYYAQDEIPNSCDIAGPLCLDSEYVKKYCVEVTEEDARKIHPNLFEWLSEYVPIMDGYTVEY